MENSINILDPVLADNYPDKLKLIDYWKNILCIQIGWHYDLDIIWILNQLENINLPEGATIMDAGAGNGLLQFILAAKGFNIVSVDFADRDILSPAAKIFNIRQEEYNLDSTNHRYQKFICHKSKKLRLSSENLLKAMRRPYRALEIIFDKLKSSINPMMWKEILGKSMRRYGKIIYVSSNFSEMSRFKDQSFDCIVSVSAIEHDDPAEIKKAIREFERLLKDRAYMFITTSAAKDRDWYFKACQAWCFTYSTLSQIFNMPNCKTNFDKFDELFLKLQHSKMIKKRIPKIYFRSGRNGLPWGIYEPRYQPLGIIKNKSF